jgi:hypothetical protein
MAPSFSPEFRLTAAPAMWTPSDRRTEAIRVAAGRLIGGASCAWRSATGSSAWLPDTGAAAFAIGNLEADRRTSGGARPQNVAIAAETLRLQGPFNEADLPVLFIKGSSLAALAFGNLDLSGGKDIDLVVSRETLPAATALLACAGYRRFDPPASISDVQLEHCCRCARISGSPTT